MYGGNRSDLRQMTEEVVRRWVGRFLDQDPAWIIEAGTLIGHIRLDHVDLKDKRASLAIGDRRQHSAWKGPQQRIIALVLGLRFNVLKLHRVSLRVVDYNLGPSARIRNAGLSLREEGARLPLSVASGMTTS